MAGLARDFPQADRGRAYVVRPLVASIVGDLGPILIIVMSATGLLLLLACVNVTNLLLARGAARAREMAVRVALGAGRARLVRQMLTESAILACAGAVCGVLVADLGVRGLMLHGASHLPRLDAVRFDGRVLLFAAAALVISGLCVGLAPALRVARTDVRTLMNESSRSATGGRSTTRWLGALTVAEVALAIMLVAGAGWLVRTFAALHDTDAGFVTDRRLIFDVSFQGQRYPDGNAVRAATTSLMDAVRAIPGVTAVGATSNFPMRGTLEGSLLVRLHGEGWDPSSARGTRERFVSPGLFSAMGTKIISGRDFGTQDGPTTQPTAIVNRAFATLHFPGRDPIGAQFSAGYPEPDPKQEVTVVGMVDDVREKSLSDKAEPAFYTPLSQAPIRRMTMVVATSLPVVTTLEPAIRDAVHQRDPEMAVDFDAASDVVGATIRRQQLGMTLMLIFGGIAVLLSAVGIYGVVAYAAVQRRDEMATRLALGASPTRVFWLVMKQGGALACAGAAIGVGGAYLSGRIVSSQIYAVRASDPLMLGAAIAIVVGIMAVATMIPAWRASRLSPSHVLRLG
jgi:putative ABC transport system permease protein